MAFKKLVGRTSGLNMGNKKGEVKSVEGFLVGIKVIDAKKKGWKDSLLYKFVKSKGERFEVWGGGYINSVCADGQKLSAEVKDKYVRFEFKGYDKAEKGQKPGRIIEVSVDDAKKMPKDIGRIQFK